MLLETSSFDRRMWMRAPCVGKTERKRLNRKWRALHLIPPRVNFDSERMEEHGPRGKADWLDCADLADEPCCEVW